MTHLSAPRFMGRPIQRSRPAEFRPSQHTDVRTLASLWEIEKRLEAISLELLEISAIESRCHEVRNHHPAH